MMAKRGRKKTDGAPPPKKGRGRPSDFRPEYCDQVEKLCLMGMTDEEIADFFGKSVSTINLWKTKHPDFSEALKRGKLQPDLEVATSLFKNATGYVLETDKVIGKGDNAKVVTVKVSVPGDTTAQIFWLKNRRKLFWRDKQDVEHGVTDELGELLARIDGAPRNLPTG